MSDFEQTISGQLSQESSVEALQSSIPDESVLDWRTYRNAYALSSGELRAKLETYFRQQEVQFTPDEISEMQVIDQKVSEFSNHYFSEYISDRGDERPEHESAIVPKESEYLDNLRSAVLPTVEKINQIIDLLDFSDFGLNDEQIAKLKMFLDTFPEHRQPRSISDMETVYDGDISKLEEWRTAFTEIADKILKYLDEIPVLVKRKQELESQKGSLQERANEITSTNRLEPKGIKEKIFATFGKLPDDVTSNQALLNQTRGQLSSINFEISDLDRNLYGSINSVKYDIEKIIAQIDLFKYAFEWAKKHPKKLESMEDFVSELALVRVTNQNPQEGEKGPKIGGLEIDGKLFPGARLSVHYTLNGPVVSHLSGTWGNESFVYVVPLEEFVQINGKPAHLSPGDTWFLGESTFPEKTILLAKSGCRIDLPSAQRERFKIIQADNPYESCEGIISEMGYPSQRKIYNDRDIYSLKEYGATTHDETHSESGFYLLEAAWGNFVINNINNDESRALDAAIKFLTDLSNYSQWPESERIPAEKVFHLYQPFVKALQKYFTESDRMEFLRKELERAKQNHKEQMESSVPIQELASAKYKIDNIEKQIEDFDRAMSFLKQQMNGAS